MSNLIRTTEVTADNFAMVYSPQGIKQNELRLKTINDLIELKPKSLAFYKKEFGEQMVSGLILLHLMDLNNVLGLINGISQLQAKDVANEVLDMYYYLSFSEIDFIFRQVKIGNYGEVKFSITTPQIFGWFKQYDLERSDLFIRNQRAQSQKLKDDTQIIDGKLYKNVAGMFNTKVVETLKDVAVSLPSKEDEYRKWKQENKIN